MACKDVHIIFQHGWAFSPALWETWRPFLPDDGSATLLSRGYFSPPSGKTAWNGTERHITICHSLGLHLLPVEILKKTDLLAIFGGFKHFHGEKNTPSKLSKKIVRVMLKEMKKNPQKVLETFYSRCGLKKQVDVQTPDTRLLIEDLTFLDENDLDLDLIKMIPRTLIFHGKKDRIVPFERAETLNEKLENSELIAFENQDHALPFNDPEECMNIILKKAGDV